METARPVATREVETTVAPPPPPDPETLGALELLEKTHEKLTPNTWLQGWGVPGRQHSHCVLGWVSTLAGNETSSEYTAHLGSGTVTRRVLKELEQAIRELRFGGGSIIDVNDRLGLEPTRLMVRQAIRQLRRSLGLEERDEQPRG